MRGGSIVILCWATILAVLAGIDWFWAHDGIDIAMWGAAVFTILAWGIGIFLLRPREALRRGPPEPREEPEALASASYGSVLLAVGVASLLYGFAFGHFLVYFGIGLIVVALGLVARERYDQRRAVARWRRAEKE